MSRDLLVNTFILWLTMHQLPRTTSSCWVWNGVQNGGLVLDWLQGNELIGVSFSYYPTSLVGIELPTILCLHIFTMYWLSMSDYTSHTISPTQLRHRWRYVQYRCFTKANLGSSRAASHRKTRNCKPTSTAPSWSTYNGVGRKLPWDGGTRPPCSTAFWCALDMANILYI